MYSKPKNKKISNNLAYPKNVAPFTGKALKAMTTNPLPNIRRPPSW